MKNIESFFKDNLAGKEVNPPQAIWQRISQTPELRRFNRMHRLKRLALYSFGGVTVAVVIATVLWLSLPIEDKNVASQSQLLTTNTLSQAVNEPVSVNPLAEQTYSPVDNSKEANNLPASAPVVPPVSAPGHATATTPSAPISNATADVPKSTHNNTPKAESATAANSNATPDKTVGKPTTAAHNITQSAHIDSSITPPVEEAEPPMEDYELFMPNAFSPNGDGVNDHYELSATFEINNFSLFIYDRTGQLVFKSTDMAHTWTGEMNGKTLPAGTYTYLVKYVDELNRLHQKKGSILIIR